MEPLIKAFINYELLKLCQLECTMFSTNVQSLLIEVFGPHQDGSTSLKVESLLHCMDQNSFNIIDCFCKRDKHMLTTQSLKIKTH